MSSALTTQLVRGAVGPNAAWFVSGDGVRSWLMHPSRRIVARASLGSAKAGAGGRKVAADPAVDDCVMLTGVQLQLCRDMGWLTASQEGGSAGVRCGRWMRVDGCCVLRPAWGMCRDRALKKGEPCVSRALACPLVCADHSRAALRTGLGSMRR
jgi:hypothetical protein